MLYTAVYPSPLGPLILRSDGQALTTAVFGTTWNEVAYRPDPVIQRAMGQLEAYFAGEPLGFDLPIRMEGTRFQQDVWHFLMSIPWGTTWTYGELARALGKPKAARAVGAAVGANPLAIIIPCHRVLPASGGWGGYRWGVWRKAWLLRHEGLSV